jgi:murein DD-endopeptidase MepM/ murein hydrolase activator NlpD
MRRWPFLFLFPGGIALFLAALSLAGCAAPARHYASADDFAPNSPRPLAVPRAKPDPPARPSTRSAPAAIARSAPSAPAAVTESTLPPLSAATAPNAAAASGMVAVGRGDTIYALARRYDRTPRAIIDANGLKPPYLLYPGQKLRLDAPRYHVVKRGETGYSISRRYNVDVTELMRLNEIGPPYTLAVGQRLQVPGRSEERAPTVRSLAAVPPPPARSSSRFAWPVRGKILSTFGPKAGGRHNDGINIAAAAGTPVLAAENGVVAYAGNDLKGFGNLVLIRHQGGWITAYGHNDTLLVKRGDTVKRGQPIARVGSSGNVGAPQLHFEIRKGVEAVNPQSYL